MIKQSFFDPETERFTDEGRDDCLDIETVIADLVRKYREKGYRLREIEYVIIESASIHCLSHII